MRTGRRWVTLRSTHLTGKILSPSLNQRGNHRAEELPILLVNSSQALNQKGHEIPQFVCVHFLGRQPRNVFETSLFLLQQLKKGLFPLNIAVLHPDQLAFSESQVCGFLMKFLMSVSSDILRP